MLRDAVKRPVLADVPLPAAFVEAGAPANDTEPVEAEVETAPEAEVEEAVAAEAPAEEAPAEEAPAEAETEEKDANNESGYPIAECEKDRHR